LGYR